MTRQVIESGGSAIVYDDDIVSQMKSELFNHGYWTTSEVVPGYSGGRGATLFVNHEGQDWVLRHYYRGGMVGKVLRDQFLWIGAARTRPFREWELLQQIQRDGLPAPVPVAARYARKSIWYTADLITKRLADVMPFSNRMAAGALAEEVWNRVGICVGQFHEAGYFHADLSTHNLQIDSQNNIYLLDWDRGERRSAGSWREANLARLLRSCRKISKDGSVSFKSADWSALQAGYRSIVR